MKLIVKIWWSQFRKRWVVLGIALLLSLLTSIVLHLPGAAQRYMYQRWQESASLVDVVIGYKGAPTQIVASALYRMENPTGNLPIETAEYWRMHPLVQEVCPISLGDNIEGIPVIGVDINYYNWFGLHLEQGNWPINANEIVVSETLAAEHKYVLGATVHTAHGSDSRGEAHAHHDLLISGIFSADRTADEQSYFVTNAAYSGMHNSDNKDFTSLLMKLKSKSGLLMLPGVISKRTNEQGAFPVFIFGQLQKQWQPTLDQATFYGKLLSFFVALLFIAFLYFIGMTENSTVQLLRVKGIDSSTAFLATYGLYFFAGFGGLLCGIQLFNVFGLPLSLKQSAVGLVPLILSAFLLYMKMNKK
jgi:putative ABC transport system permease protein